MWGIIYLSWGILHSLVCSCLQSYKACQPLPGTRVAYSCFIPSLNSVHLALTWERERDCLSTSPSFWDTSGTPRTHESHRAETRKGEADSKVFSQIAQLGKNTPAMQEAWVWSLGGEDPLEKDMATHSSILAWRIPWTEELGRLQSTGSQESDTT